MSLLKTDVLQKASRRWVMVKCMWDFGTRRFSHSYILAIKRLIVLLFAPFTQTYITEEKKKKNEDDENKKEN
jgi:hypothetical protein